MIYKVIGILVILAWFFYVYTRQPKEGRVSLLLCLIAMAIGAFPVFFAAFFFQIYSSAYLLKLIPDFLVRIAFSCFVLIAFSEEGFKFLASRFLARKYNRKIDYIVIFASVATGFELFESFYQMEDLISMIIRCVFATHIAMQIIMADFYYQKKTVFALLIPVLLHGFLDFAIWDFWVCSISRISRILIC